MGEWVVVDLAVFANGERVATAGDNGANILGCESFDGANPLLLFVVPDSQLAVFAGAPWDYGFGFGGHFWDSKVEGFKFALPLLCMLLLRWVAECLVTQVGELEADSAGVCLRILKKRRRFTGACSSVSWNYIILLKTTKGKFSKENHKVHNNLFRILSGCLKPFPTDGSLWKIMNFLLS